LIPELLASSEVEMRITFKPFGSLRALYSLISSGDFNTGPRLRIDERSDLSDLDDLLSLPSFEGDFH
jgi:hypothetical protein